MFGAAGAVAWGQAPTVGFEVELTEVLESDGSVDLAIVRTGPLDDPVVVVAELTEGTATAWVDFAAAPLRYEWPAGVGGRQVQTVELRDDNLAEGRERFSYGIVSSSIPLTVSRQLAGVAIVDNNLDFEPLAVVEQSVTETAQVSSCVRVDGSRAVAWQAADRRDRGVYVRLADALDQPVGATRQAAERPRGVQANPYLECSDEGVDVFWLDRQSEVAELRTRRLSWQGNWLGGSVVLPAGTEMEALLGVTRLLSGQLWWFWQTRSGAVLGRRSGRTIVELAPALESPQVSVNHFGEALITGRVDGEQVVFEVDLERPSQPALLTLRAAAAAEWSVALSASGDGVLLVRRAATAELYRRSAGEDWSSAGEIVSVGGRPYVAINSSGDAVALWQDRSTGELRSQLWRSDMAVDSVLTVEGAELTSPVPLHVAVTAEDELSFLFVRRNARLEDLGLYGVRAGGVVRFQCGPLECEQDRFRTRVRMRAPEGVVGLSRVRLTDDTSAYWWLDQKNIELIVKSLDACALNGQHWAYAAGLTTLPTWLLIEDSATGVARQWWWRGGSFVPLQSNNAFDC